MTALIIERKYGEMLAVYQRTKPFRKSIFHAEQIYDFELSEN